MAKQTIRIILKSGNEFVMVCDELVCVHNKLDGTLTSIKYEGATSNIPLYIDMEQVAAVLQKKIEVEEETPDGLRQDASRP